MCPPSGQPVSSSHSSPEDKSHQSKAAILHSVCVPGMANSGYAVNVFPGKAEQMVAVASLITEKGFLPEGLVRPEVEWFYSNLGIDDMYFMLEDTESISKHIMALYGAKIQAFTKNENELEIHLERETEKTSIFIHTSRPGVSNITGPQVERRIDNKYLDISCKENAYRLESFRAIETPGNNFPAQLRCYFVTKCDFKVPNPTSAQENDIQLVSDKTFLQKASENTLELYGRIMKNSLLRTGPVIELVDIESSQERRVVIGYRQQSTMTFFSALSDLYHYYSLYSTRKYVEQFSNGITIISLYLNLLPSSKAPPIDSSIHQVMKEASLVYCLPTTPLQSFFQTNILSLQETIYGYIGWIFCQHFLNRLGSEYSHLVSLLDSKNPLHLEILNKIKRRLRTDTFTREYILDIIKTYPDLVKALYTNFAQVHYVGKKGNNNKLNPTLSFQRISFEDALDPEQIKLLIRKTVSNGHEKMVFECMLLFNQHVLKTNFYQPTKVALSFRLDPCFLPQIEYPLKPFAMFMVVGNEFRGFHIRFCDIARGGIRIIKSRNNEAYSINLRSLLDENYALANTQQRKNKDIPEGGSKGTILLDFKAQDKAKTAFEKYVDAMLDLLLLGETPGIKDKIADRYGRPEILFFGPDEGTAEFMDWASLYARKRNAKFWKAFTTGKSQSMGGIPHDLFGMTTRSVHQYVLGILRKLGVNEEDCTKIQTGGPDGDLGSNEIKISKDKTIGIVDGSGVLYDPNGLDRTELLRLANERKMICQFDKTKLSPEGFRVLVDESSSVLPNGEKIYNTLIFRNEFHLLPEYSSTLFVPCGGRPEAVDISNVQKLLTADNQPRFKYIIEGANLFFTQEARLRLEQAGSVIFKDASANKGGVTSSSLEVLAALAFNDEEFETHMCVRDANNVPEFYKNYVTEVHEIIERNAELEFECIWREWKANGTPMSVLSDEVSFSILKLSEELEQNTLWQNLRLRRCVLEDAIPKLLLQKLGFETIVARLPENYTHALFGSYLASRFVYSHGVSPTQCAFFEFMAPYFERVANNKSKV